MTGFLDLCREYATRDYPFVLKSVDQLSLLCSSNSRLINLIKSASIQRFVPALGKGGGGGREVWGEEGFLNHFTRFGLQGDHPFWGAGGSPFSF